MHSTAAMMRYLTFIVCVDVLYADLILPLSYYTCILLLYNSRFLCKYNNPLLPHKKGTFSPLSAAVV